MPSPEDRRQKRLEDASRLLIEVYRQSEGKKWQHPQLGQLAEALGWTPADTFNVATELVARGWLEQADSGPSYRLTSEAADIAERAIMHGGDSDLVQLVERLQADRTRLLQYAYESANAVVGASVPTRETMSALGLARDQLSEAAMWLHDRGLLEMFTNDSFRLTEFGVDRIEAAEDVPAESSVAGMAPLNVAVVVGDHNTVVQVAQSSDIVANVQTTARAEELLELLHRVDADLELTDDAMEARDVIRRELDDGRTDSPVAHRALAQLGLFASAAGANTVGNLIFAYLAGASPF